MKIRLAALLAVFLLTGCYLVSYEDVSSDPKYASYVGAEYRTTGDMTVYRVSMDQNYGLSPSVYEIVQPPGFDGPEVISRTRFPEGSTMKVLTIQRCTDCFLDTEPRVHATVRVTSTTQLRRVGLGPPSTTRSRAVGQGPPYDQVGISVEMTCSR